MPNSKYYLPTTYLHAAGFFFRSHNSTPSQEIPRILGNSMIRYRICNSPPLVPVLSQINPVYVLLSAFFKVHIKILLTHMSAKWSTSFRFPHENHYSHSNKSSQPYASISQIYCSTCFGHPHAHHQELINCSSRLRFTVGTWW